MAAFFSWISEAPVPIATPLQTHGLQSCMELGQRENRCKPVLVSEKVEVYYRGTTTINLTEK